MKLLKWMIYRPGDLLTQEQFLFTFNFHYGMPILRLHADAQFHILEHSKQRAVYNKTARVVEMM